MRLKNRTTIITGGASGMGKAGAKLFAAEGANVVVADLNEQAANAVAKEIRDDGGKAIAKLCDVTDAAANEELVSAAITEFGALHVFWANAGLPQAFRPISDIDPDEFDRLIGVNAKAPWLGARAALSALRDVDQGSFIITASLSGLKGRSDASAYQPSKGAATMLIRSLAKEFGPHGIRVNSVCPIAVETPMWSKFMDNYMDPKKAAEVFAQNIPLGRLAEPEDVAKAALFFASDDSAYISGVNLPVDGGSSA